MPSTTGSLGYYCRDCQEDRNAESDEEQDTLCGYCNTLLEHIEIIECPACGSCVPEDDFLNHLGEGCE